jgi:hypothetical protein
LIHRCATSRGYKGSKGPRRAPDDRYTFGDKRLFLTGNQALVRLTIEQMGSDRVAHASHA